MTLPLIVQPLRPKSRSWTNVTDWPMNPELRARAYAIERWYNRAHEVQVISSIEVVSGEGERRPEYHVSVSALPWRGSPKRCSESLARWVLREFDFTDYAQDNHVPSGIVRNYWRPVAQNISPVCHCIDTEPRIIEDRGDYIWRAAP
jgi:hypothetical protein